MNGNTNFNAVSVAANSAVSAFRGVLALQGTGLSSVGVFGERTFFRNLHSPICTVIQDKPSAAWHPVVAKATTGAFASEAGYAPADMQARLRRTAHQASVIRGRQRCRPR